MRKTFAILLSVITMSQSPADLLSADGLSQNDSIFKFTETPKGHVTITGLQNDCVGISDLIIPRHILNKKVFAIEEYSFAGNQCITSLTIHSGIIRIGESAFSSCSNLVSVVMQADGDKGEFGLQRIEKRTFEKCVSLCNLVFPPFLNHIGGNAFADCAKLSHITMPYRYCNFEDSSFIRCTGLKRADMGNAGELMTIVFPGCVSLSRITVSPDNEYFKTREGVLCLKNWPSIVRYPPGREVDKVKVFSGTIGIFPFAFEACKAKEIILPDGLAAIARGGFNFCTNITTITIPATMKYLDDFSFSGCSNLTTVVFKGDQLPELGDNVFPPWVKFKGDSLTAEQIALLEKAKERQGGK